MAIVDKIFRARAFPLPSFEPLPLEFEKQPCSSHRPPVPTAGELHETIERHLRGGKAQDPGSDAVSELRDALAELRRSLG